jgi:hypothetical protein
MSSKETGTPLVAGRVSHNVGPLPDFAVFPARCPGSRVVARLNLVGTAVRPLPARAKAHVELAWALYFNDLESGQAVFRRRSQPVVMPAAPNSDQMARVQGSGTASEGEYDTVTLSNPQLSSTRL